MTHHITLGEKLPSFSEIFTAYLSDISLEVEAIKLRNMKSNAEGVNEHLARIDNALKGIINARLTLAESLCNSQAQN